MDDVLLVKDVFENFDIDCSGCLDLNEFDGAVAMLLEYQLGEEASAERIESLSAWRWWDTEIDKTGAIGFREFLKWYSCNAFSEDLMTTEEQKELRDMARTFNVKLIDVERIKAIFDSCDAD